MYDISLLVIFIGGWFGWFLDKKGVVNPILFWNLGAWTVGLAFLFGAT